MKICARCKCEKNEEAFSKCKTRKDGLSVYCKICKSLEGKKYNKENRKKCADKLRKWREKNPEKSKKYSAKDREKNREIIAARRKTPEARSKTLLLVKKWRQENRERFLDTQKKYKEKNRNKINARFRITNAIRRGKIKRGNKCQRCGIEGKMEAHHKDYDKPFDVQWLCFKCHKQMHGKLINAQPIPTSCYSNS